MKIHGKSNFDLRIERSADFQLCCIASFKTRLPRAFGWAVGNRPIRRPRAEDGFAATVLFIGLLAIMLMLATAGGMAVVHLHNEVKVLERQQIKRFDVAATNSVAVPQPNITRVDIK